MLHNPRPRPTKQASHQPKNTPDQHEHLLLDALTTAVRKTGSSAGFLVFANLKGDSAARYYTYKGKHASALTTGEIREPWRAAAESGKTSLVPGNLFSPGCIIMPVQSNPICVLVFGVSGKIGSYRVQDVDTLQKIGRDLAAELEKHHQFSLLEKSFDDVIRAWAHAIEIRERSSHLHQYELAANWTAEIAREVGLAEYDIVHLRRGAILHDIGKMAIPETILCKPDSLSPDEWDLMRRHPELGYEIIAPINLLSASSDVILSHHERWDGTGYPNGLSGSSIPLPARIFTVVDVWDALVCDLPYRPAWPKDMAYSYIRQQSGKQFDPDVVDAFFRVAPNLKSG